MTVLWTASPGLRVDEPGPEARSGCGRRRSGRPGPLTVAEAGGAGAALANVMMPAGRPGTWHTADRGRILLSHPVCKPRLVL